jgi:hypothetical protein
MQDASSADRPAPAGTTVRQPAASRGGFDVQGRTRAAMVALGFIPALHAAAVLAPLAVVAGGQVEWRYAWLAPIALFLAPPLAVRVSTLGRPISTGRVETDSAGFLHWWFTAQCQVVFTRLPFLEELLRLIPGLYSLWLRMWGAQIGSLVYWSPGVAVLDRPLLHIGNRVIFGIGVRLNGHVLAPDARGTAALYVAPISIGNDVLVGGYSLLLPGCTVADAEVTPPFRSIHAFSRYEGGRRTRASAPTFAEDED